jgi:hypothetical protein
MNGHQPMPYHRLLEPPMFRTRSNRFSLIVIVLMSILVSSCELFSVREPEEPLLGTGGVFLQPDTPNAVLDNLINAIREMNAINYLNCLSPIEYRYNPANLGNIGDPGTWDGWSRVEEDRYFKNLASAAENLSGHSLTFDDIQRNDLSPQEQQIVANYALVVNTNRNTSSRVPNRITGQVIFILRSDNSGLWSIVSWTDIATNPEYNWSQLKAEFIRG